MSYVPRAYVYDWVVNCRFASPAHLVTIAHVCKMSTGAVKTNRLALEKSPYLLQHATNPVDWYPWGEEAFEKAKKENKLIFLSVGYSTCHWFVCFIYRI